MKNLRILIPTHRRESEQVALRQMPREIQRGVTLYAHDGRAERLRKAVADTPARVVDLGVTHGIADVRQKMIEHAHRHGAHRVLMLDDHYRLQGSQLTAHPMTGAPVRRAMPDLTSLKDWSRMLSVAHDYHHASRPFVGIYQRAVNFTTTKPFKECTGNTMFCSVDLDFVFKHKIRFDLLWQKNRKAEQFEDVVFVLQFLRLGVATCGTWEFCFSPTHGRGGGNNTRRTNETQRESAMALQQMFPLYVTAYQRADDALLLPASRANPQLERAWNVKCQWRKLFLNSLL